MHGCLAQQFGGFFLDTLLKACSLRYNVASCSGTAMYFGRGRPPGRMGIKISIDVSAWHTRIRRPTWSGDKRGFWNACSFLVHTESRSWRLSEWFLRVFLGCVLYGTLPEAGLQDTAIPLATPCFRVSRERV